MFPFDDDLLPLLEASNGVWEVDERERVRDIADEYKKG